ncbi:Glycosyltransferase family 28 N-terminal domain [Rhizoctonia solani]|uniref:Glycosyltransferase family 28 N-terminal domain n=1 Tax=Rhizoctonia solani TaxID=456999 RepID=A0A8H7I300_9AGAM|nr:Glycosyltransferase family 28 N-terminal domain [Rhizoctonia solani]
MPFRRTLRLGTATAYPLCYPLAFLVRFPARVAATAASLPIQHLHPPSSYQDEPKVIHLTSQRRFIPDRSHRRSSSYQLRNPIVAPRFRIHIQRRSHSIGGTHAYLSSGVPSDVVKKMGRWSSDAFLKYWRNVDLLIELHAKDIMAPTHSSPPSGDAWGAALARPLACVRGRALRHPLASSSSLIPHLVSRPLAPALWGSSLGGAAPVAPRFGVPPLRPPPFSARRSLCRPKAKCGVLRRSLCSPQNLYWAVQAGSGACPIVFPSTRTTSIASPLLAAPFTRVSPFFCKSRPPAPLSAHDWVLAAHPARSWRGPGGSPVRRSASPAPTFLARRSRSSILHYFLSCSFSSQLAATQLLLPEDVVGFYFLDMAKDYSPPRDLVEFLNAGPPPVYIGFGSIVLEDPKRITGTILTGVAQAGVRAIISPGWGGLDEEMIKSAGPHVFALGNVPHDWLFQYVSAVCHHGGAGTTAAGLKCGKPTIIVPFFGDQPWWATQIASRGAGPPPLDHKTLTPEMFASAIRIALSPSSLGAAKQVGKMIMREVRDGAGKGVESFHRHLPLLDMKCDLTPNRVAVWYSAKYNLRLSAFAAQVLAQSKHLKLKKLKLYRSREYNPYVEAVDPVTGTLIPALRSLNDIGRGIVKVPTRPGRGIAQVTRASARGIQGTLQGAAEGVSNMPRLYGSEVREHKKVTGLGSGIAQGTKGLVLGIYDGVSDFVTEPTKGLKNDGFYGAVGGLGVGTLNLVAKPVGGALQFVSMPIEGTARSLSHKEIGKERIVARRAEGIVASERASLQEQYAVIEAFVEYKAKRKGDKKGKVRSLDPVKVIITHLDNLKTSSFSKNAPKGQIRKEARRRPFGASSKSKAATKNPLFTANPRNFGIGHPSHDRPHPLCQVARIRSLQRQKVILNKRLKVPPAIAQFDHTLDKNTATQLFKLLNKYRPETKQEKKARLDATAKATAESKEAKDKARLEEALAKKANLVVIANDVDPIELVVFLPALCRKMGVPYVIVKSKARLGTVVHKKTAAVLTLQDVRSEDNKELSTLVSAAKANFTDKYEEHRRHWGGGLRGNKSTAKLRKRAKAAGQTVSAAAAASL